MLPGVMIVYDRHTSDRPWRVSNNGRTWLKAIGDKSASSNKIRKQFNLQIKDLARNSVSKMTFLQQKFFFWFL